MPIISHASIKKITLPEVGVVHQTIAGRKHGSRTVEIWMQAATLNSATPLHYHDCEEIVIVLRGEGWVMINGKKTNFGPGTTIIVEPKVVHQMKNTGSDEMFVIAVLSSRTPKTYFPDGKLMPLPWAD